MKKNISAWAFLGATALAALTTGCQPSDKKQTETVADVAVASEATKTDTTTTFAFENAKAKLTVSLEGSYIPYFAFKEDGLNPFTWSLTREQVPENNKRFPFKGHFLCNGRWGAPSDEEIAAGIPHNGEVNTEKWQVVAPLAETESAIEAKAFCASPLEKLDVTRHIRFSKKEAVFQMSEEVTNTMPLGRAYNFVQHGTLAAPFLTASTLIDCNGGWGFNQKDSTHELEQAPFRWPNGLDEGEAVNLRVTNESRSFVTTHIFDEGVTQGWLTATNPDKGLVLGYIWDVADYPWINIWNQKGDDGAPAALGLEFGTTGKGIGYKVLLENGGGKFKGVNSFEYIEAGESKVKSYTCFLLQVPEGYKGVAGVSMQGNSIEVTEQESGNTATIDF